MAMTCSGCCSINQPMLMKAGVVKPFATGVTGGISQLKDAFHILQL